MLFLMWHLNVKKRKKKSINSSGHFDIQTVEHCLSCEPQLPHHPFGNTMQAHMLKKAVNRGCFCSVELFKSSEGAG